MMAPHHGGALVILGAGGGGGPQTPAPSNPKALAMIPLPKGFDLGDTKPGDKLDVTAHCQLSDDGTHLEVLSVDGAGADDDTDDTADAASPGGDDDAGGDDSAGSRWQKLKDRQTAADA